MGYNIASIFYLTFSLPSLEGSDVITGIVFEYHATFTCVITTPSLFVFILKSMVSMSLSPIVVSNITSIANLMLSEL